VLEVETIDASVRGASGGLLDWLVNVFIDILSSIMRDTVVTSMASSVQAKVDAAISDAMAGRGAPAGATVTVRSISINTASGITVDPFVALSLWRSVRTSSVHSSQLPARSQSAPPNSCGKCA
jgi:hypothetical protein